MLTPSKALERTLVQEHMESWTMDRHVNSVDSKGKASALCYKLS